MYLNSLTWRYTFSKKNRHRRMSVLIMISLAIGLAALIIIMSVMNSLQDEVLDQLRSVDTFHIEIDGIDSSDESVVSALSEIDGVDTVYPFIQTRAVISSAVNSASVEVKAVTESFLSDSNPFSQRVMMDASSLAGAADGALIGFQLVNRLSLKIGDPVTFTYLAKGKTLALRVQENELPMAGIFSTPLREVNTGTVIIPLSFLTDDNNDTVSYGLYLDKHYISHERSVVDDIQGLFPEADIHTWQNLHGPFYSALMLEKVIMYVFLFFMFFIISYHLRNSTLRLYQSKQREIAILRSIGVSKKEVRRLFTRTAMLLTVLGMIGGLGIGILASQNLETIFRFADNVLKQTAGIENPLLSFPITIHLKPVELILTSLFIGTLSYLFSFQIMNQALKKEPMEMLHHE